MPKKQSKEQSAVEESIRLLPEQIESGLKEGLSGVLDDGFRNFSNVVLNGMGGSNLGARIIASVFADRLKIPFSIIPGYDVPWFVSEKTLYILSSYSGTTEEPLAAYAKAKKARANVIAVTARNEKGSGLSELAKKNNLPLIEFETKSNPSGQPRLAAGSALGALVGVLIKTGILNVKSGELALASLKLKQAAAGIEVKAMAAARKIAGKMPVFVAGDFFEGNLHTLRNQINETAKNFAAYLTLPELNHYAMEGLGFPARGKKELIFVFFRSAVYPERLAKRLKLTEKVVAGNKVKTLAIDLSLDGKIQQSLELLSLGSWLSYHLAVINKVNPKEIKWVDWFKKQLG